MAEKRYDTLLMLSGGKDSTYLAYQLVKDKKKVLAFTHDVGFMSDVARRNIERVQEDLGIDHLWFRGGKAELEKLMVEFREKAEWGLPDICGQCSFLTLKAAIEAATLMRIRNIVGGFTKFSTGRPPSRSILLAGGIVYQNPYFGWYNWGRICDFLEGKGFVTDPTVTNCSLIHEVVHTHSERFGENPYKEEFEALLNAGQIDDQELNRFKSWCSAPLQSIAKENVG